jgi:uncharacterized repeat protein (TIGR01451 family)
MKRSIGLLTVTAVLAASLLLILTIVTVGAFPAYQLTAETDQPGVYLENEPWMRVNYDHEWVGGNYPAGHKFDITLKDKDGNIKATAEAESTAGQGWEGDGFNTEWEDWMPTNVDIVVGDVVLFQSDDGYTNEVKVGQINGDIDLVKNGVSGDIQVPWLSGELPIECHPWGAPGDWPGTQDSSAAADGSSASECFWDPMDWTVQTGQDIAVMYREADNDRVIAVFQDPAPNMTVDKWPTGDSDKVALDGPAVFTIRYHNYGEALAPTVFFTDTLPAGTTYVADSSGVTLQ